MIQFIIINGIRKHALRWVLEIFSFITWLKKESHPNWYVGMVAQLLKPSVAMTWKSILMKGNTMTIVTLQALERSGVNIYKGSELGQLSLSCTEALKSDHEQMKALKQ